MERSYIMNTIDFTAIALALIGMVSGWATYWFDRRKHQVEVKTLEAQLKALETETRQKEMNLSKDYVTEFRTNIAGPLQQDVKALRLEVKELRYAIERISDCPHSAGCPVRERLLHDAQSVH